jgi:hypothetical protein
LQTGSGNHAVDVGYFCRILFHLKVLLDLGNMAYLAWSTRRSLALWPMQKLAKLAGYNPEVEIAPSMSGVFCQILLHLEVLFGLAWST